MEHHSRSVKHVITTEIDDLGRRKFKLEEHDAEPLEQTEKIINLGDRNQSSLLGRDDSLNIEKYIGRIQKNKKIQKKQVFHCDVCDQGFKCDMAYITHLNSPTHNLKLGMNMKVKAVTTDAVTKKIEQLTRIKKQNKKDIKIKKMLQKLKTVQGNQINQTANQVKNNLKKQQIKIQQLKKQQPKKQQQEQINEQSFNSQQLLMKTLGLPISFGKKKIKN